MSYISLRSPADSTRVQQIPLESSRFHWSPADSTGVHGIRQNPLESMESGRICWSPVELLESSGVQWSPVDLISGKVRSESGESAGTWHIPADYTGLDLPIWPV